MVTESDHQQVEASAFTITDAGRAYLTGIRRAEDPKNEARASLGGLSASTKGEQAADAILADEAAGRRGLQASYGVAEAAADRQLVAMEAHDAALEDDDPLPRLGPFGWTERPSGPGEAARDYEGHSVQLVVQWVDDVTVSGMDSEVAPLDRSGFASLEAARAHPGFEGHFWTLYGSAHEDGLTYALADFGTEADAQAALAEVHAAATDMALSGLVDTASPMDATEADHPRLPGVIPDEPKQEALEGVLARTMRNASPEQQYEAQQRARRMAAAASAERW